MALKLEAQIGLDGAGFQAGMNRVMGAVGSLKTALASAFTAGAVASATRSLIRFASEIKDTATRLGMTTTEVQELSFAADQSGSTMAKFAVGLDFLARQMESAAEEGGDAAEALLRLGASWEDIRSQNPAQVAAAIGKALQTTNITSQVSADLTTAMGRAGTKLIPVLKELEENIAKVRAQGSIVSPESIDNVERMGDKIDALKNKIKSFEVEAIGSRISLFDGEWLAGVDEGYWEGKIRMSQLHKMFTDRSRKKGKMMDQPPMPTAEQMKALRPAGASNNLPWMTQGPPASPPTMGSSDGLVSVGNFLGSNRASILTAAEKTNKLLTLTNQHLADIKKSLTGSETGFPPT